MFSLVQVSGLHALYVEDPEFISEATGGDPMAIEATLRRCGLTVSCVNDEYVPVSGRGVIYLVTVKPRTELEFSLGTASDGLPRLNNHPCP